MIVRNVIAVIFLVITGTTLVTYATSESKRHLESKWKDIGKVIGHKRHGYSAPGALQTLSNFDVIRRSLNPVSSKKSLSGRRSVTNVDNKKSNKVIEKLKLSVTFRDNILYVLSYLLHGRENGLTEEQYTSLQLLYDIIRKKMVYMYNMLPSLSNVGSADKNQQTKRILLLLTKNLPPYLQCTAKFLANEIQQGKIDFNVLLASTKSETFNYFANINLHANFRDHPRFVEETKVFDQHSNITQKALGPIFVQLLYHLHAKKLPLTQELFGLILINLPNPSDDPVLEENVRYLYDITINNLIMDWDLIGRDLVSEDAYKLVFSVLSKILVNSNTGIGVRNTAVYIYNHLKFVVPTHANPNFQYMYNLIKQDIDMGMLLSAIVPEEFGPDAVRIKDRLLMYFKHNYKNKNLDQALKGFNRFAYRDPLDLLLAFLTRIVNRVPASNADILQPVTALLPALIMKKYVRMFTPFASPEIDVLILLESIKSPDIDPVLTSIIDSIKLELISQPQLSVLLSTLMPVGKDKCLTPRQCLINTFQEIQRLQGNIPLTLITRIQNVVFTLNSPTPTQHQPQGFLPRPSTVQPDMEFFNIDKENPIVVIIEPDNAQTPNIPELGGSPYAWNIDKYIDPVAAQDKSLEVTRWELIISKDIDSKETKEVSSPTIDQTQLTEHVPSGETFSDKSTILTNYVSSQIASGERPFNIPTSHPTSPPTNSPTSPPIYTSAQPKKPKKSTRIPEKPHHTTSATTADSSLVESSIETEDTPVSISQEKESPHQPTTSKESEIQPEETNILITKSIESHEVETTTQKVSPKKTDKVQMKVPPTSRTPTPKVSKKRKPHKESKNLINNVLVESSIETEDTSVSISQEKESPHQPTTNKESEIQPEETNILITKSIESHEVETTTQKVSPKKTDKVQTKVTPTSRTPTPKVPKKRKPHKEPKNLVDNVLSALSPEILEIEIETETTASQSAEQSSRGTRTKPSPTVEEKATRAENVSAAVVLPPSIEPDQPLTIYLSNSGVPVVTTDDSDDTEVSKLVLPGMKELLEPPNINKLLKDSDTPIVTQVLDPLVVILGKNYIKKLNIDPKLYSTNIALLLAILKKAKTLPQVAKNVDLTNSIQNYITTIDYVSPTILLPVITSAKKLTSRVVYSTFNKHDLTYSGMSENPPNESSPDIITMPLINPKTWLQSVNSSDPYSNLLPILENGDVFEETLKPLRAIFKKITGLLEPDFQPLIYPNRGALLITVLQKLLKTKTIQSHIKLKSAIEMYLHAIQLPSVNINISEDNFMTMLAENTGYWQPELTSLIYALSAAKNDAEIAMTERIEHLLADPSLLEKLQIAKPPSTMSRGELLHKIILTALETDKMHLEKQTLKALKYYENKVKLSGMGALPIMWVWVEVYVVKAEVNLGSMIQNTLDFDKLPYKKKVAYNDFVTYLAENQDLLQNNEDFDFEKYKTQGEFVKALFKYLLTKTDIDNRIKKIIHMLLPHIMLSGRGAIKLPSLSLF